MHIGACGDRVKCMVLCTSLVICVQSKIFCTRMYTENCCISAFWLVDYQKLVLLFCQHFTSVSCQKWQLFEQVANSGNKWLQVTFLLFLAIVCFTKLPKTGTIFPIPKVVKMELEFICYSIKNLCHSCISCDILHLNQK